ncbi:ribonuclease III [Acholeplasma equifetale]|uniref:ribonuclease III n=1 Tax=Acholeplasma equifetale TaxID=264634 RepID=UPI00047BD31A|nr:ribonuclease III [Acholeplasma equifetale]
MKINELFKKIGIEPKNVDLYLQALTHSSYAHENKTNDYERLEFLGDAVIQIIISTYMFKNDDWDQGTLTKKRAQAVREEALFLFADKIDLASYMLLGNGEQDAKQSMIADAYEALYAAIYLDLGIEKCFEVFERITLPYLPLVENLKDYKTKLQELIQVERKSLVYKTYRTGGPSHRPIFKSEVLLEGEIKLGSGTGHSTKEAEQNAAKEALSKVVEDDQND